MIRRRKIGSVLRPFLEFTAEEWANLDLEATPVIATLKQGSERHLYSVQVFPERRVIQFELVTRDLRPGLAAFDVWLGDEAIPGHENIMYEFFHGAGR